MKTFAAVLIPLVLGAATALAADGRQCLRLAQIDETPIIDDRTILVKMKGGEFHRVDLRGNCPSLRMSGFAHRTPSDDLCTSTVLTVRDPGGTICTIERIVPITRADADALMAKR
jgi:hypothetical protein